MKNILELIQVIAWVLWITFTDKEQRRQFEYDLGGGEIEP